MGIKMRKLIVSILLCLLQIDAFAADYAFASSSKLADIEGEIDGHFSLAYKRIFGDPITLSKSGYYVFMEKERMIDEFSFAYIPLNSEKTKVSYAPEIPYYTPGPETGKWLECNSKLILKHKDKVKSFCENEIDIPDSTRNLVANFFDEKRMSIVEGGFGFIGGGLFLVKIDEQNNRSYFHMPSSKSLEKDYERTGFISKYLKLYDDLSNLMMTEFESCRWTNFGNAADILKVCRDFVPGELQKDAKVKSQILQDSK